MTLHEMMVSKDFQEFIKDKPIHPIENVQNYICSLMQKLNAALTEKSDFQQWIKFLDEYEEIERSLFIIQQWYIDNNLKME